MKSKNYIINKIDVLVHKFSNLSCKYGFDNFSNSHYIEILPSSEYYSNNEYAFFEVSLINDFINEYPDETITFLTEGDLYEITEPIYIRAGLSFLINKSISEISSEIKYEQIDYEMLVDFIENPINIESNIDDIVTVANPITAYSTFINSVEEAPVEVSDSAKFNLAA